MVNIIPQDSRSEEFFLGIKGFNMSKITKNTLKLCV